MRASRTLLSWDGVASLALPLAMVGLTLSAGLAHAAMPGSEFRFRTPTLTTAALNAPEKEKPARCKDPECARRELDEHAVVRISGEFGSFTGRVTSWGRDSLSGFQPVPDTARVPATSAVQWSQVARVDQRIGHSGSEAALGATFGVALGAVLGFLWAADQGNDTSPILGMIGGALICGSIGGGLGAISGARAQSWKRIYQRP